MYSCLLFLVALGILFQVPVPARQKSASATAQDYHDRAIQLTAAGDSPEAGKCFRKAWEMEPTKDVYAQDLAVYYIHHQEFPNALAVITDYVKRYGPTALGWTLQGEYLFELKQYDASYQSLREALDLSNTNYRAHELLGLIFSLHHRYDLGLEEMKTAVAQNPASAQTHFYCGRLFYRSANYPAAQAEFEACLKLHPAYPQATENLGLALEATGNTPSAQQRYREAIQLEEAGTTPRSDFPYVCLAVLLLKQPGNDRAAEELLNKAASNNPNSAWAHFELGRLYYRQGADDAAVKHLTLSSELDHQYSRPHFFMAKIYQRSNHPQEAQTEFARFKDLDSNPDNRQPQITR